MSKRLIDLHPGQMAVITDIRCNGSVRKRLVDMGIVPGTPVEVRKKAPFGDPILIRLRGYLLSLRREEARGILVEQDR